MNKQTITAIKTVGLWDGGVRSLEAWATLARRWAARQPVRNLSDRGYLLGTLCEVEATGGDEYLTPEGALLAIQAITPAGEWDAR